MRRAQQLRILLVFVLCAGSFITTCRAQSSDIGPSTKSRRQPVRLAQVTPQSIYVPLVALDDPALAELYLNNVAPKVVDVRYTIHSSTGESVAVANLSLNPWEARRIRVSDLLKNANSAADGNLGGMTLDYTGRPMGLLAQMLYLGAGQRNSIDGIFFYAMDLPSAAQNATWSMPRGSRATLVLGNSSDASLIAELSVDNQEEQKLTLAPHETRLLQLKDEHERTKAHFAKVNYSGPSGVLREAGFVVGEHGYAAPIRFYDREASPQADLFASDLPVENASVTMTLLNTGSSEVTARPTLLPIGGSGQPPIELEPIRLGPGQSAAVALHDGDQHLPARKADAFSMRVESTGGPGDLIGSLVSVRHDGDDISVAEVPLRTPGKPGQSTGSYPLRLDGDFSSQVTITNVGKEPKQYYAYIQQPSSEKYVFHPRTLAPGEIARFDINAIRDQQEKDAFGHTLPRDFKTGKFVWSIAVPWASARMIGRAYIRSLRERVSASFSCGNCCPSVTQGPFADPEPGGFFLVGAFASGTISSETNDCEGNLTVFPDSLGSNFDNPSVLNYSEPQSGAYQTTAIGPGSTSMSYQFFWAEIAADSQDCFLLGTFSQTNTDPGDVASVKVLQGGASGTDITNQTQSVVVGQQIQLTASYTLPSGVTVSKQSWKVDGTTVGGFSPSNQAGGPASTDFTQQSTTFYWVVAGDSQTVTLTATLSNNSTVSAKTTFNVAGPTQVRVTVQNPLGQVVVTSAPSLECGNTHSTPPVICIAFTAQATPPSGVSNHFQWVQLITNDTKAITTPAGKNLTCTTVTVPTKTAGTGLDTEYPFGSGPTANDEPEFPLDTTQYIEVTRTFSASMYLMWSRGLTNDIFVPLGLVNWQFSGDAKATDIPNNKWTLASGAGSAAASQFTASTSYPTWTNLVDYNSGMITCH